MYSTIVCFIIKYFYWIYLFLIVEFIRCDKKILSLKLYLLRQKWRMNEILIFFKIVPSAFDTLIPLSFFIRWSTFEVPFLIVWSWTIIFLLISSTSTNITTELNLQLKKKKSSIVLFDDNGGYSIYTILCFTKIMIQKVSELCS